MQRVQRSQVTAEQTWNLNDLFTTRAAWEAELLAIEGDLATVTKYQGKLGESAHSLAACLDAQETLTTRLLRTSSYATMRLSADSTDTEHQSDNARASALGARIAAAVTFIQAEILALSSDVLTRWIAECASLAPHQYRIHDYVDMLPHTLSAETEMAISRLRETLSAPQRIYTLSKGGDMKFAPVEDDQGHSHAVYDGGALLSPDHALRRCAYESYTRGLKAYRHTYAATFSSEVQTNIALGQLRNYQTTTHMLLAPHKVSIDVYEQVLNNLRTEIAPHMRRFQQLRRRQLGLDSLLYCDLTVPLGGEPPVTYEEAQTWILEALKVLGDEYHSIIRKAFADRWIDRADNEGKRSGAFCNTVYGAHSYVFMTWADQMRPVFTLAHELGHAGHLTLAAMHQRQSNMRPTTSFIEAPSTMNELLLAQYLLSRNNDESVKRSVLFGLLGTYHHNFVNHLLEAELQRQIYTQAEQRVPITEAVLTSTKGKILEEFWGDAVTIDEGATLLWMRQPHYYMGLYPYTYALGLTISTAAAAAIADEGQPAAERWLAVLKAGGTRSPIELAAMAGVDIEDPASFRKAAAYVGSLVDTLEQSFNTTSPQH